MIFDLDGQDQGTWFRFFTSSIGENGKVVYDDPLPDAGRVCIRNIGPVLETIQGRKKKKYEFVLNPVSRQMERVGYYEELSPEQAKAENDEIWDYCITGIENFYDRQGKEITATKEYKAMLMNRPVFSRFVGRCLQIISGESARMQEELEKNLEAGLSGSTNIPTNAQLAERSTGNATLLKRRLATSAE